MLPKQVRPHDAPSVHDSPRDLQLPGFGSDRTPARTAGTPTKDCLAARRASTASKSVDKVTSRFPAISFRPLQNSSSRLTLVLWPARTIERFTTGDFMQMPPICSRFTTENKKLVLHYGCLSKILQRGKKHTVGGVIVMLLPPDQIGTRSGPDYRCGRTAALFRWIAGLTDWQPLDIEYGRVMSSGARTSQRQMTATYYARRSHDRPPSC